MALVIADRVRETTTTTGTGAVTLAGAYTSFQSFLAAVGNGNSTYYTIASAVTGEWEVGIGTYTSASNTLSRTTVLASSNAGSLVNFSSGAKDVFVTQPAERSILVQSAGSGLFSGVAAFTANGVPYASSTSTLTTGSALTFDGTNLLTLSASAPKIRVSDSGLANDFGIDFYFPSVSASYGQVTLNGATGAMRFVAGKTGSTGYYQAFELNGSEQMRLTSTGLGIGTSSPGAKLDVNGSEYIRAGNVLRLYRADNAIYGDINNGGSGVGLKYNDANGDGHTFQNGGTTILRLDSSGNLGLGVTPSAWNSSYKAIQFGAGGAISSHTSSSLPWLVATSNAFINSSGNWTYINNGFATRYFARGDDGSQSWSTAPSGTAGDAITFTQAMTLDASGNLGIGTSSPAYKLDVTGTAAISGAVTLSGGTANGVLYLNGSKVATTGTALTFSETGNETKLGIKSISGTSTYTAGIAVNWDDNAFILYGGTGYKILETSGYSTPNVLKFFTNNSEAMRLTSTGLGIGTSSPGSFAGTVKAVVGGGSGNPVLTLYGGNSTYGGIYFADGTTGNELYRGFFEYNHSTDSLLIGTAASTKATLDSSGNLGLGVTPSASWSGQSAFQVNTRSAFAGSSNFTAVATNAIATSNGWAANYLATGTAALYTQSVSTGAHAWYTAPSGTAGNAISFTQAMTLDASGNLLVGTTTSGGAYATFGNNSGPGANRWASVFGTNSASAGNPSSFGLTVGWNYSSGGGENNIIYGTSGGSSPGLAFSSYNGTTVIERARIDSSGNLGLGVTPSAWGSMLALQLGDYGSGLATWKTNRNTYITSNAYFGSDFRYATTGPASYYNVSGEDGAHRWFTAPSGTAGNAITFTQAMSLLASNNLLIGTTTDTSSGVGPLVLNKATNPGYVIAYNGTEKAYQYMPSSIRYRGETVSGVAIEFSAGNSNGVSLASGGTSWGSLSDERKKDIIEPITNAVSKVASLRSVIGKYKTDDEGTRRSFLIAQDVQAVLPEAVAENGDGDLILQYTETIPLLVAAIKEQQALIQQLTARVAQLESN